MTCKWEPENVGEYQALNYGFQAGNSEEYVHISLSKEVGKLVGLHCVKEYDLHREMHCSELTRKVEAELLSLIITATKVISLIPLALVPRSQNNLPTSILFSRYRIENLLTNGHGNYSILGDYISK